MAAVTDPFEGFVPEISLPSAPLFKVLAQIRYPRPLGFDNELSVAPVRAALASRYPVNRETNAMAILLTPDGITQQPSKEVNWVFEDVEATWKVTLSDQSVSIETTSYISRLDFTARLSEVIHVIAESIKPPVYDRLGVRYINRIEDPDALARLQDLVQPVALAGISVPHANVQLHHSLCDSLFVDGNAQLQVRWGWLPQGAGIDPSIPPPSVPYWLFDIDSFTGKGGPFVAGALEDQARDLAERAHRFFRWTVTDEFIRHFGGEVR